MAKKTYAAWTFQEYESDAFAEYLEQKAREGWHLRKIGSLLCFEKGEPCKRRFFVTAFPYGSEFDSSYNYEVETFRKQYEEEGWTLQYGGRQWQVFYTEDPEKEPPRPDREQFLAAKRKAFSIGRWASVILLTGLLIWFLWFEVHNNPGRFFADGSGMLASISMVFLLAGVIQAPVRGFLWYHRAGRQLAESGTLPKTSFAKVRKRNWTSIIYTLFWLALLFWGWNLTTAGKAATIIQAFVTLGICSFVLWWVRECGEGTRRDNIIGYFVGAFILVFVSNMLFTGLWMRILPEEKKEEPKQVLEYPVDFAAYGYEPWEENYRYFLGTKSFLAAYQCENLMIEKRLPNERRQESLRIEYYSSPVSAILSATRDGYPSKWQRNQKFQRKQWQEGSAEVVCYQFTEYEDYELYLLYDEHRLLVLDFSDVPETALIEGMIREFAGQSSKKINFTSAGNVIY